MVFVKNNTDKNNIVVSDLSKQKSNLAAQQDLVLNNKLTNNSFKKDINALANQDSKTTTTNMTDSTKDQAASAAVVVKSKKSSELTSDSKTKNFDKTKISTSKDLQDTQIRGDTHSTRHTTQRSNPFLVTFELNVVAIVLFLVAFGLRIYELDQPTSVV